MFRKDFLKLEKKSIKDFLENKKKKVLEFVNTTLLSVVKP